MESFTSTRRLLTCDRSALRHTSTQVVGMTSATPVDGKVRSVLLRAVSSGEIKLHPSLGEQQPQQPPVQLRKQHRLARANTFVAARTTPETDPGTATLEQLVECPLCRGRMREPRMLPACQHSFCRDCLTAAAAGARSVCCPVCGATSALPAGGVSQLPGNLYVGSLLRLLGARPASMPPPQPVGPDARPATHCALCGLQAADALPLQGCKHCRQSFCDACWPSHETALEDQLSHMRAQVLAAAEGVDQKEAEFKEQCDKTRGQLVSTVDSRVAELRRLQQEAEQRLEEAQRGAGQAAEQLRSRIREAASRLASGFQELQQRQHKVDSFLTLHGETSLLLQEASNWSGGKLTFNTDTLEVTLSDEAAGSLTPTDGTRGAVDNMTSNAAYRSSPRLVVRRHWLRRPGAVSVCPWPSARHLLYVAAREGGLLAVDAASGRLAAKHAVDGLLCPAAVAFSADRCYVTDKYAHCVHELDCEGRVVATLGKKGGAPGQFRSPEGLAVVSDDAGTLLYVCDTGNDRLQVLRPDGTVERVLGVRRLEEQPTVLQTEFDQPTGVAVAHGRVAVADSGNNRVKVYNMDGEKILELTGENGAFNCPECVALDRSGRIIVGDSGNQRVQVYSEDGRLVCSLGGRSSGLGWVSGVAATDAGELVVTDGTSHALYVF